MVHRGVPHGRIGFGALVASFVVGRPAVWVIGAVISVVLTGAIVSLATVPCAVLAVVLVVLGTLGVTVKDQVRILGGRIVRVPHRPSRRRVLAMAVAIGVTSAVLTTVGRVIGRSVVSNSEREFRRRAAPDRNKGER